MRPFRPPFSNQNQVRGGNDPCLQRPPSSSGGIPKQFGFNTPQSVMPMMGEFNNQNALLGTLLAQQQLIQGLQNNLLAALSQQGLIPQFQGQHINLLGGLQNPNLMPLQQGGFLGHPPSSQNLNQATGCPPNGFICSQNPNFAPNPHLPVMSSGNPSATISGNGNLHVAQSISNSACLETQLASQKSQEPMLTSSVQNFQSSARPWPQMAHSQAGGTNFSNNSSKYVASNNFKTKFNGSCRMEPSHMRFQKTQSYSSRNAWNKERSFPRNDRRGQLQWNEINTKPQENSNTSITWKRPLSVIYDESEIQQWREARKKNFPTRANIEKKLNAKEGTDFNAKALRQQLREVLAKQAELGIQVAEVPSTYLTESEEQASRNTHIDDASNRNTQAPNRNTPAPFSHFNKKRGRFQRDNRNPKKHKFKGGASPAHAAVVKKRDPTLLRKLLNADIRRDQSHLLQVFRFIVLNSFFADSPDKPLVFPIITAKYAGAPATEVAVAELLPQNDAATPNSEVIVSAATCIGKNQNEEQIESDPDDLDGASDVVCDANGEDFAAGDDKSEEGEITD